MAFFDLSIPYSYPSPSGGKELIVPNKLRVKLATKAMELGYVGIAHSHSIEGAMSEKDSCTIPLLTLGSLVKAAPRLASSLAFHRGLLNVPRSTPFRQYTRVTVKLESKAQCLALNSGNPVLKSYDIVAVRPVNQYAFDQACAKAEVDVISIDFSNLQFRLMHPLVKAAVKRGVYFEIKYSLLLSDAEKRRQVISNAKLLVDWTKGKNLIISSGAPSENKGPPSVTELRGPNDVINLMSLLGLSSERARAAISVNCRNMIAKVLKKKRFHKEAVKVELLSSSETFSLEQPLSGDCMKWDPLSSGEGDLLLEDLAKAFEATTRPPVAHKAFDFTSDRNGLPSRGFRMGNILGTEPLTQSPAAKMIDAPVQCKNQVSEVCMADSVSCDDNLGENETISQIDMLVSEDDNKVEPTTNVPLSSQGQGVLMQDEAAATFSLIRCTESDAASDVNMQTELDYEDKSMSLSKSDHGIQQSHVENLNMETIGVDDEFPVDGANKEGAGFCHANIEQPTSSGVDEMKIDGSLEANHNEYMEVTVEDVTHETGDNNIILPNLSSSETTELLRESSNSLISPEAVGQDHDQLSRLEFSETELGEEPSVQYDITMEDKKETETNQQAHVKYNARNSGKARAKRSWVRLTILQPLKPFLLQRFKRISKRRKHIRA
ncbi:hypothetical protein IGI04_040960 [Brassica rapa subsp. trilocularis]|uniref:RNase P subunit p30 family protein n=1 Tax=Brassica rapa subsp. trilocularis TaxID=1813537 RepID=A0ABQ7KSU0_BRACM|nr:hypothetical protein IGI04_040960 [Brassica rapa subsp. trilocularis]